MAWTLTEDVDGYLATAGEFLGARAAENTIILTATQTLRARGNAAFGDVTPLFGWWRAPGGPITAAFMHTPPYGIALTAMTGQVAAALAGTLAGMGRGASGVNGDPESAAAFARAWEAQTGQASRPVLRSRMYRLGQLRPPEPPPPGAARVAAPADRDLLTNWCLAFQAEADQAGPPVTEEGITDRLSFGGFTLWETADGPVSLAGRTRVVAGQVRVGPVYTPPEQRGQGFAGAVAAAVSRAALDEGVGEVLLFTDLANPTSNALYQRLGYCPVSDRVLLLFGERSRP